MLQRAFHHIGDDFHVAMRVHGEAAAAGHAIVVHHAQGAKVYVLGVVVLGERKAEMRIQPTVIGMAAFVALANLDHVAPFGEASVREAAALKLQGTGGSRRHVPHNTRYHDYCQEAHLAPAPESAPTLLFL